jgi:predicted CoA-substrate-specific enzyme activase
VKYDGTVVRGELLDELASVAGISTVGVDVGAVSVGVVALDGKGQLRAAWRRHQGHPVRLARELLAEVGASPEANLGVVGSGAGRLLEQGVGAPVDTVGATIRVVLARFPQARHILDIGGGSLSRISLDDHGKLAEYATNSLCAAGTGSFLDEQARRLGLDLESTFDGELVPSPPAIATRCAVFAKSDLIHRQQEGYSKAEMWSGLCRGLSATIVTTLFKGKPARGLTVLVGGVARNAEVLRWMAERLPDGVQTFPEAHLCGALGAARLVAEEGVASPTLWTALSEREAATGDEPRRAPLVLERTKYPSFEVAESFTDDQGNEVRVHALPAGHGPVRCWLGLDIGSTSTKVLVLGDDGAVLVDVYRMTGGDPIGATRRLFTALDALFTGRGRPLSVLGCATTGSGRKLVGAVVGADLIQNEITAHVTGAMQVDPSIDTIFEIGGQDAKYMDCRGGYCRDAAMNYVCAAGTGSFVAEQAARLGFRVQDIGDATLGQAPPFTSDRCTVFMEQDVDALIRRGFGREEVMAAVLYSVIRNYLTKVVGPRYRSDTKVFFQGATARNKGLVAALENLLGVEVVVSPLCHVMGAYGAALLVAQRASEQPGFRSRFLGLDLATREVTLTEEICDICENKCVITHALVQGQDKDVSWGYLCGREPDEHKVHQTPGYEAIRERQRAWRRFEKVAEPRRGKVGIPRAMITFGYLPMLQGFLAELGWETVLSRATDEEVVRDSADAAAADYCFPIKLAHGHLFDLAARRDVGWILAPVFLSEKNDPSRTIASNFCPLNTGLSAMYMASLGLRGQSPGSILRPCVDLRWSETRQVRELHESLGQALGASRARIKSAWRAAVAAQARFDGERRAIGERALARFREQGKPAVVVLGRPYNLYDERANIGLPRKIAEYGLDVVPMDCLALDRDELPSDFHNVFWKLGQDILLGAQLVARTPGLYAVVLTNFSCGPDSFLLSYLNEVMGEKPHLVLELDEHGADAGYVTRVEAFLDVVKRDATPVPGFHIPRPDESAEALRRRTVWLPPMHPFGAHLLAAALRGAGFDARPLPPETRQDFERGRALTRGTECLPAPCSIGVFLRVMEEQGLDPARQAFFMPKAAGPCRFGQYALLHRLVLNRAGLKDVAIMSPISENAYADIGGTEVVQRLWRAILTADALFKLGCRVRPYERDAGHADHLLSFALDRLVTCFEQGDEPLPILRDTVQHLARVPRSAEQKPLVGIVGEIYVRSNVFSNQDLVGAIERAGGEAWLTPISEWIRYLGWRDTCMAKDKPFDWANLASTHVKHVYLSAEERVWEAACAPILGDRREPDLSRTIQAGRPWIPIDFEGEAILTIGRTRIFAEQGASLVVNVSPFGCMVGSLSAAVLQRVQEDVRMPVLNMFYDGDGDLNRVLDVFLAGVREGRRPDLPDLACPPSACEACGGGCGGE